MLRFHGTHTKSHNNWFRHSKVSKGDILIHSDTQISRSSHKSNLFFLNKASGLKKNKTRDNNIRICRK
jgi:hypothetical protein